MIDQNGFVGIDVAKTHFDIHLYPSDMRWRSSTHAIEIDTLVQRLLALDPVAVGLEASGGYEQTLADRLHAAGLKVYLLPPARVRSFAQSIGLLAKTDRIDAAVIARYLGVVHERLTPYMPDPARQRLHAITAHRRRLVAEKTGLLSQLDTIAEPIVRGLIEARMVGIAGEIKTLEAAIADLLAQTPPLRL